MSRILIVEDDVIVRLVVSDALQESGFHVHEAANAMEAIAILERGNGFDLVLSDIRMPGEQDGLGLLEWARIHHPTLPIIITSGYIPDKELILQPERGERFIQKPANPFAIAEMIKAVLDHKQPN
jgi:CheY-like chemotaxis protein